MLYIMTCVFAVISGVLLSGRGAFLIAGYNTASEKDKLRYDKKKLCRVVGSGFSVITVLLGITAAYGSNPPDWLGRAFAIVTLVVAAGIVILANTVCGVKNPPVQEMTEEEAVKQKAKDKKTFRYSMIFTAAVFVIVGIFLVTGDVQVEIGEEYVDIRGSYWPDESVALEDIVSVAYREDFKTGSRVGGLGSFKLQEGNFRNEEFGNYTLYAYAKCRNYMVLETSGRKIVVNGRNREETKALYEKLLQALGESF